MAAADPSAPFYRAQERALADDERLSSLSLDPVAVGMPSFPVAERLVSARSTLTIEGASTVTIGLHDPDWIIEQSGLLDEWADGRLDAIDITFDGLAYRLAKVSRQDDDTQLLTFEDLAVALLRSHTKHLTASRGSKTRAQFIEQMVREVKAVDIPFYSPEKATRQAIQAPQYPTINVGPGSSGFDKDVTFKIKGVNADAEQKKNVTIAMTVADELGVTPRARLAALVAGIGESSFRAVPNAGGSPYGGVFQGKFRGDAQGPKQFDISDTEGMARSFFKGGKGYQAGGAIKLARENPGMSVGTIAYKVEGDISNFPSPADAERFYQVHHDEAEKIAAAWNSGDGHGANSDQVLVTKQFQFTRGLPGKKESSWTAANRLAGDVNWRFFVAAGIAAFVSDDRMLLTPSSIRLDDFDAAGLTSRPTYDWDQGKQIAELTQPVSATAWSVRPATVVHYADRFGKPVAGRWLVHTIEQNLLDATDCTLTLIKPLPPRKEPATEVTAATKKKDAAAGSRTAATGDVKQAPGNGDFKAQTTRPDGKRVLPNAWLEDFLAAVAGRVGHTLYTNTYTRHPRLSSSNLVSDHWSGDAADINVSQHGGNYPNPYGTDIARAAFEEAGASPARAAALASHGGTYERLVTKDRQDRHISVQVLWGPNVGHVDHVHIGVRLT